MRGGVLIFSFLTEADFWRITTGFGTLFIAFMAYRISKLALQSSDAPRPFIKKRRLKNRHMSSYYEKITVEVDLTNFGSSRALNSYLVLSFKNCYIKEYHLSRLEMLINESNKKTISISFLVDRPRTYNSLLEVFHSGPINVEDKLKLMVFANDFFGRYYVKKFRLKFDNTHLNDSYVPFKQVGIFNKTFWEMQWFKRQAIRQKNTYPEKINQKTITQANYLLCRETHGYQMKMNYRRIISNKF
ncbi:hypothetical protein [Marinococcus halotolerans]|uniref:hypothetical protein n=1 Tax=Marinococcus halotolerans TaxID=301092 RepID=UPI00041B1D9D|nr:hypothetical protein [Marinococcus halotolerans]